MPSPPNPYPGPRSFQRGERLYGRDRETAALLDLLIAERIILLYSPSGAGKTSLLQAGLIPALEAEGFRVLPTMRVNAALPGPAASRAANRYTLSCLLSLEEAQPETGQRPLDALATLSLNDYLASHATPPASEATAWHGDVLIFDQFEEVLALDPTDRPGKLAFFEQVGEALRDRGRWAIFAMREEFIAGLDPYLKPIPTRFDKGRRFRLELLNPQAAIQAIQQPARLAGVDFTDAAATRLVEDLAAVRVQQPDGSTIAAPGDAVEPVQLQVVCWRLWQRLAANDAVIDLDDIAAIGDVDAALRSYYAETVIAVAKASGVSERAVRDWVEERLITGQEIRGQVLQGVDASEGLSNTAIWQLVDAHLLRAEQRRGATWFELAHDRLVRPVREDNATWREATLSPMQRAALRWQLQGKPPLSAHLLAPRELAQAEQWAKSHPGALSALDREFLAASQETQRRHRMRRRLLTIGGLAAILLALTLLATGKLLYDFNAARQQNRARAVAAQARNVQFSQPDLSLLLSVEALSLARQQDREIDAALLAVLDDNPQLEQVLHTGDQPIKAVAISPTGSLLAAGDEAGQVRLWDRQRGAELAISPLDSGNGSVVAMAMTSTAAAAGRGRQTRRRHAVGSGWNLGCTSRAQPAGGACRDDAHLPNPAAVIAAAAAPDQPGPPRPGQWPGLQPGRDAARHRGPQRGAAVASGRADPARSGRHRTGAAHLERGLRAAWRHGGRGPRRRCDRPAQPGNGRDADAHRRAGRGGRAGFQSRWPLSGRRRQHPRRRSGGRRSADLEPDGGQKSLSGGRSDHRRANPAPIQRRGGERPLLRRWPGAGVGWPGRRDPTVEHGRRRATGRAAARPSGLDQRPGLRAGPADALLGRQPR
ncbi:MAG: ATP-binding protein [Anaerolineae bacterium]